MGTKVYYTYYSYEEFGRGYIGAKPSGWNGCPEKDPYKGYKAKVLIDYS